mgnify:CR=1 FL=1
MSEFIEPWEAPMDDQQSQHFQDELQREIAQDHILSGLTVRTLAYRVDRDDVAFIVDGGPRVAVVHLTYSVETTPDWPTTKFYDSVEEFLRNRMKPDHEEYVL